MNLWDALTDKDPNAGARFHCWTGERFETVPWSGVVSDAAAMTLGLRRAGVTQGTRVASLLTNSPSTVRGLLGVWLAGGAVASLPIPARGLSAEEYLRQITTICEQLDPVVLLLEEQMLGIIPEELRGRLDVRSWESFAGSGRIDPTPPEDDDVAFVQYSSGSTSAPKGCMLTPRAIAAQLELVREMIACEPGGDDAVVSWLPLSHDMGIFGCLMTPWVWDFDLYLSTPQRFMFSPRTWFGDLASTGATITAGTNTALHLSARASGGGRLNGSLERMHTCIIGAERVEWPTLQLATEVFGSYGFREQALMPAYGLAEATLAATAVPRHEVPRYVSVDPVALAEGDVRDIDPSDPVAARIVSSGVPCQGVELVDDLVGQLGQIRLRTPSLAAGYFGDEALTNERFVDGSVLTGDLGFVRDGHVYPVGRVDDVIAIAGRKVYAREVETAVEALGDVRAGCSTLVERSGGGSPRLALLMELKDGCTDYERLAREAATVAMSKAAVALDDCVFLQRGTLPKTPTGKIQRYRCRQLLEGDRLEPLASIDLARS